ncbi:uncharacterized protein LOC135216772 isoform X2 [Macrobrachium nipponense]|uniref:uncharacterized protein LOC135216772 isoform X2 n=1 Tax=Macrobrachium nipponense TaxID=159736 RepID=UPI0030C81B4D
MHEEEGSMRNESVVIQSESSSFVRPPTPPVFSSFGQYRVMTPKEVRSAAFASDQNIMKSAKEMESNAQSVVLPTGAPFWSDTKTTICEDHMQVFLRTTPTMTYIPRSPYILRPYHQPLPNIGQHRVPEEDEISIVEEGEREETHRLTPPPSYDSATNRNSKWMEQPTQDSWKEEKGETCKDKDTANDDDDVSRSSVAKKIHCFLEVDGRPESAKSAKMGHDAKAEGDSDEEEESTETDCGKIVELMGHDDLVVRLKATIKARRKLSLYEIPEVTGFMAAGIINPAVESLQINNTDLQYEALWVLTNIASGKSEDTKEVVDRGSVPLIVGLLNSPDPRIREQAIWALGNIAGDAYEYRKLILDEGAMALLVDLLNEGNSLSLLRNTAWMLCNITRHKPMDYSADDLNLILKAIKFLLENSCHVIQSDALWALSYITDGPNEGIQAVIDHGLCPRIVELMKSDTNKVSKAALRTCGNIATGSDVQTDAILKENTLEVVKPMLVSGITSVKKEICWFLSNVTAGTRQQIQRVIDAHLIERLVDVVSAGPFEVSKEAIWALSNITSGADPSQVKALTQAGGIKALLSVLDSNVEGQLLQVALEGISNILNTCHGLDEYELVKESILEHEGLNLLEIHLHSQIESVSKMVNDILDHHFQDITDDAASAVSCDDDHEEAEEEEEEKAEEEEQKPGEEEAVAVVPVENKTSKKPSKPPNHAALKYTKS